MPSNTPMTAAQLLALADRIASAAFHDGYFAHEIDDNNIGAIQAAAEAYRAARAASPVTLEEALMIDEALAFGRVTGDDDGTAEWAIECRMARQRHSRRLAGEGGGE